MRDVLCVSVMFLHCLATAGWAKEPQPPLPMGTPVLAKRPDVPFRIKKRACELTEWERAADLDTLAAAYAEAGDFDEAVRWQTKALALPLGESLKKSAEERLELYRDHQAPPRQVADAIGAPSLTFVKGFLRDGTRAGDA